MHTVYTPAALGPGGSPTILLWKVGGKTLEPKNFRVVQKYAPAERCLLEWIRRRVKVREKAWSLPPKFNPVGRESGILNCWLAALIEPGSFILSLVLIFVSSTGFENKGSEHENTQSAIYVVLRIEDVLRVARAPISARSVS